ncbi:alpha-ketoacid dehydrogenase subunit alpha/beta [Synechococcus sp. PROS-9-1]|uniref:dehydrogenase E1 component subunit alpha/beta n=1 Tax=Synechococcus sp. PROS-9-1 TaxID=1968775 RepID=UPI0021069E2F|nr:alpha-ketoacid dehydrogenase subunit alpha/beta [Synechococcus sp. PROS-9-1]
MLRIRMVEEKIAHKYSEQQMRCPVHLSIGQEAPAVGVCSALDKSDWVFSGHRNHAHYLAKGGDLKAMISEIYGKATGCCGGKGGSMHLTDKSAGFIGATPIVGSTIPIAVGAALTAKRTSSNRVVTVFLGDGAMESGVVHESLNFAATANLPVLFVCENNLYSVYSPLDVRQPPGRSLSDIAKAHCLNTITVDGNNVGEIYDTSFKAINDLRNGSLPYFLELPTYRWREHCGPGYDNDIGYRTELEFESWREKDPIVKFSDHVDPQESMMWAEEIQQEIEEAFVFAETSCFAPISSASENVYHSTTIACENSHLTSDRVISYAEAIRESQDYALANDQGVYLMGLGVPDPKGIFGTTLNLQNVHGIDRVFDIPLSENAITGVAIGSAITGMRPILTHQRLDFSLVSIDQIVNQAAKWHYMFNGTMSVPLVIRMIIGRGWGQGPQHSQSLHAWFAHIPGLKVVMPSSAYDAKGMLSSAIKDNNPVLFLEHRWLHNIKGFVPSEPYFIPLSKAAIVREGSDITLVGVSYMTLECLKAAETLLRLNISVEVIDLRSIHPLDTETLLTSVNKTKRLLVVDHAESTCGISAEVIALVVENFGKSLLSNPKRVCLPPHPVPTCHALASEYYPTSDTITRSIFSIFSKPCDSLLKEDEQTPKDQPNREFIGPF